MYEENKVMTDYEYILEQCGNNSLREIPSIKLVEFLYSSPNDYTGKNDRERSMESAVLMIANNKGIYY